VYHVSLRAGVIDSFDAESLRAGSDAAPTHSHFRNALSGIRTRSVLLWNAFALCGKLTLALSFVLTPRPPEDSLLPFFGLGGPRPEVFPIIIPQSAKDWNAEFSLRSRGVRNNVRKAVTPAHKSARNSTSRRAAFYALIVLALAVVTFVCAPATRATDNARAATTTNPPAAPKKVIIDTDPGTDDALAILLALNSPELDVRALTVVPGNVTAQQGLENALKLASLTNRCDIPVAGGAQHPLFQKLITAELWHGANGLANVELPASKCKADPRFGPDLIIQMIHESPHEITLVPVGPLTNIALALLKDPSIVPLVKEVVIMGGSISGGNVNAAAEANIYNDPEAAQIVFHAGWRLTMVGLDVGDKTLYDQAHLDQLSKTHGPENDFAVKVLTFLLVQEAKYGAGGGSPMYDPLAVGTAVDPSIVSTQAMHVDVESRGEFTRGETVANRRNAVERNVLHGDRYIIEGIDHVEPNVQVCTGVNADKFLQLLNSRLAGK
jgi:inosine-uridine nucleoside N-ribohydrolase